MRRFSSLTANQALKKLKNETDKTAASILREHGYGAHNYHPIPVVFDHAEGAEVWDPNGKRYLDFLASYSAVNQGHAHPKIVDALTKQASKLALSSRAFYSEPYARFAQYVTEYFNYERMLPMNTGAEAVETAIKLARRWGYYEKNIKKDEALIVVCKENFHGRTLGIISMSTDPDSYGDYGPFLPGFVTVPHGNADALSDILEELGERVAGFLVEPIQGEAGVQIPPDGYLTRCAELCKKHNVLLIADEIQSGLARSGKMLACDWDGVRPDVLILGKALSGGIYPVSAVLADTSVMSVIYAGQHGSTYGGNPLASEVGIAALQVLKEERLADRAQQMGSLLMELLVPLSALPYVKEVRGRGLFCALEMHPDAPQPAFDACLALAKRGVLCKPTHDHIIRLTPPLVISEEQVREAAGHIIQVMENLAALEPADLVQDPTVVPDNGHEVDEGGGAAEELCFHCGGSEYNYCRERCLTKTPFLKERV